MRRKHVGSASELLAAERLLQQGLEVCHSVAIRDLTPIVNVVLPLKLGDGGLDHVQIGEVNFDPVEPRKKTPTILTDDPLEKRNTGDWFQFRLLAP